MTETDATWWLDKIGVKPEHHTTALEAVERLSIAAGITTHDTLLLIVRLAESILPGDIEKIQVRLRGVTDDNH